MSLVEYTPMYIFPYTITILVKYVLELTQKPLLSATLTISFHFAGDHV